MKKQQLELTPNGKRRYASPRLHLTPLRSRAVMEVNVSAATEDVIDDENDTDIDSWAI